MGSVFFKSSKEKLASSKASSFFDLSAVDIDGKLIEFSTLKQYKAIIVVNVASSCGYTKPAYKELVQIYDKYQYKHINFLLNLKI